MDNSETFKTLKILSEEEVAEGIGIGIRTLRGWRYENKFPEPVKLGRKVFFRQKDIIKWLEEKGLCEEQS